MILFPGEFFVQGWNRSDKVDVKHSGVEIVSVTVMQGTCVGIISVKLSPYLSTIVSKTRLALSV